MYIKSVAKKPNRTFKLQSLYLEPEKAQLLDDLSEETRVSKQDYLREAVDELLIKYKRLKASKSKPK